MASDLEAINHHQVARGAMAKPRDVERALRLAMAKGIAVAVPAAIVVIVGLVTLAIAGQHPNWATWLGMAAGIGVLVGAFFGSLAGFLRTLPLFDE